MKWSFTERCDDVGEAVVVVAAEDQLSIGRGLRCPGDPKLPDKEYLVVGDGRSTTGIDIVTIYDTGDQRFDVASIFNNRNSAQLPHGG